MKMILILFLFVSYFSFSQKDSILFRDKFYLELNGGVGNFQYSYNSKPKPTSPNEVVTQSLITGNVDLNIGFRNHFFKSTLTLVSFKEFFFDYIKSTSAINIGGNFLVLTDDKINYFGPYISYVKVWNNLYLPKYDYFVYGMDLYIRKFHVDIYYSKIQNNKFPSNFFDLSMYGLNIGYAFNLESFRKKK